MGRQPFCDTVLAGGTFDVLGNPSWCSGLWCYVDVSSCNASTSESSYFSGTLSYSYETCGGAANSFSPYYAIKQPRPPVPSAPPSLPMPPSRPSPALPQASTLPAPPTFGRQTYTLLSVGGGLFVALLLMTRHRLCARRSSRSSH